MMHTQPWHISIPAAIGVVFFALNAGISAPKARYVFVVFGASGIWTSLPVILGRDMHLARCTLHSALLTDLSCSTAWMSSTISYPAEVKAISQGQKSMPARDIVD